MRTLNINSLPTGKDKWVDSDEILLHASFQILENFVEKEGGDTHCNYKTHKIFVDEVRFLYNWWKVRKVKKYPLFSLSNVSEEIKQGEEDDLMLIRLIKIRLSLWT